ncbi:MAG: hemerythrin domain-containing protein [Aquificaceae bacterium]|nr:hemerythrin domain-containing protein [Aquificaceae bacterium]
MFDITHYLTEEHRECDELYAEAERFVNAKKWDEVEKVFERFREETIRHFRKEEEILFPEFEGRTGILMGPTQVMRLEHAQAKELMDRMGKAIRERNREVFLSAGETFMILIQQHNMKEEQILYPMCDQHLDPAEIVEKMEKI